jgi:plastocyanin
MNKNVLGAIITIVAAVGVVAVVMANNNNDMDGMDMSSSTSQSSSFTGGKDMSIDKVQEGEVKMDIANFAFTQKTLKIKKGTKVTWTNTDSAKHDITPDMESEAFKGSELLSKGDSYSFTFSVAGKYPYICSPHPYMKASVEVVE